MGGEGVGEQGGITLTPSSLTHLTHSHNTHKHKMVVHTPSQQWKVATTNCSPLATLSNLNHSVDEPSISHPSVPSIHAL